MNNNLAAVSCKFSQLGVLSKDPFDGVSIIEDGILPESVDLRENPLPFSDEAGDKFCEEKENKEGGGGITFCIACEADSIGELGRSVLTMLDLLLFLLLPMLDVSLLFQMPCVLSVINDNKLLKE